MFVLLKSYYFILLTFETMTQLSQSVDDWESKSGQLTTDLPMVMVNFVGLLVILYHLNYHVGTTHLRLFSDYYQAT